MARSLRAFMVAALVAALPVAVQAQTVGGDDDGAAEMGGPTFDCSRVGLRIMAPELSASRFVCRIGGALAGDASFTVHVSRAADDPNTPLAATADPLCTGRLEDGAGMCSAMDSREGGALGQVSLVATLQPSGLALGPISVGRKSPPADLSAPVQYFPLP